MKVISALFFLLVLVFSNLALAKGNTPSGETSCDTPQFQLYSHWNVPLQKNNNQVQQFVEVVFWIDGNGNVIVESVEGQDEEIAQYIAWMMRNENLSVDPKLHHVKHYLQLRYVQY